MRPNPTLDKANQLLAAGHAQQAVELLERHSIDPACAVRLRELYLAEQQREKAVFVTRQLAFGQNAEAHVSRSVMALLEGDLDTAVRECEAALGLEPDLATAHNHLGRALQNAGQSLQAVSALRKAVELKNNYPEAWANLGLVLRASGALDEAIKAYRQAVDLAPALLMAELNLGISLLLAERVDEALFCLQSLLARQPGHVEALINAGLALHLLGRFGEARQHLEQAVALDESNAPAWCYLGVLLHECHAPEEALTALERALVLDPMDIEAWVEVASIHEQAGRLEDAGQALARARQIDPSNPTMQLEWARLQRRQGRLDDALATLKTLGARQLPARLAQQHRFEAGIALDRAGHFAEAVSAFEEGNRLLARSIRRRDIDVQGFERRCQALEQWLDRGAPGAFPGADDPRDDTGADLVFLVGFPRSGTTLLDTMLDAHPEVASIEELPTLEAVVETLRSMRNAYPGALEHLDSAELPRLRGIYRAEVQRYLDGRSAPLLLDKLPLRLLHSGLISRLFPDARMVFALRHPCDVVLSNFMQAYAENEAFIHFDTLASSAGMYARTMGLWQKMEALLPLNLHYTRYEQLIADPPGEMAQLCEFMGIEPVAAMFDVEARMAERAPVRTTSYQQVAEPVYQRSSGRWSNYRPQLEPLLPTLQAWLDHYGYAA